MKQASIWGFIPTVEPIAPKITLSTQCLVITDDYRVITMEDLVGNNPH